MFKKRIKLIYYVLIVSFVNLILYNIPFFKFVVSNVQAKTFNGILLIGSLVVVSILLNAFVFYLGLFLLRIVGRWLLVLFFNISTFSVYFINTYGVFIDRSMLGNVFNTNYEEASSFYSFTLIIYLVLLGVLPSILIYKIKFEYPKFKLFAKHILVTLVVLLSIAYANSPNWLWIDKNSKKLGAIVMPWSYVVNTCRYYNHEFRKNQKQKLLPAATISNDTKSVFVLVIGESARSANFSLYGYDKNTNPLLSKIDKLKVYNANSAATYTRAGVKAILDYKDAGELTEILPNYLYRNGIDVIWRTTNWGEPNVTISKYKKKHVLAADCKDLECDYDEVLLSELQSEVLQSDKNKILIVLHTSTSHGPTYYKKYPPKFNKFTPVCKSVELDGCTNEELINAYDNTILYTDYILAKLIENLSELKEYNSAMLYVSDHGESLGEKNLYMHGVPMSFAPKEQYEIPFIAWLSPNSREFKNKKLLSQYHVFHSVLDFLSIESPIYDEKMSVFK